MWGLAVLPLEVLHHIFVQVDVQDIARLSLTCHHIRDCIASDELLWRAHFLNLFDDLIETPQSWQQKTKELLSIRRLLSGKDRSMKEDALEDVAGSIIETVIHTKTADPEKNRAFFSSLMETRSNRSCFLSRSSLFRRAGQPLDQPADSEALRQLSAKLHVFYGTDIELDETELAQDGAQAIHPCARSRVYDLRRYKQQNFWGPFTDDGLGFVDWEKVQSIMIVLACGLQVFNRRYHDNLGFFWDRPFHGLPRNSFQSVSLGLGVEDEKDKFAGKDPYNIRGTWVRVVNFLDYHDLFAYNFQLPQLPADQEREPITRKEAIRLILLKLHVTEIEVGREEDGDDPDMPRVHFKGVSKSLTNTWDPNANSGISGYVRTTKWGDIRWTTFSVIGGEERWRSECVQIGGANSARGTIGNWFDRSYNPHGPAGPTAFWKLSDDIVKSRDSRVDHDIAHQQIIVLGGQEYEVVDGESSDDDPDEWEEENGDLPHPHDLDPDHALQDFFDHETETETETETQA